MVGLGSDLRFRVSGFGCFGYLQFGVLASGFWV